MLAWLVLGAVCLGADNLLANPAFEPGSGGAPHGWAHFVAEQPGAAAALVDGGCDGGRALHLHTPLPYPAEPYNNWSQNIERDLSGKALRLTARIRTENAEGAEIWIQCWRRRPAGVVKLVRASEQAPITGTQPWTSVERRFTVPPGTDFLTIRCVLIGTGSAWFSNLRLEEAGAPSAAKPAAKKTPAGESANDGDATETVPATPPDAPPPVSPVPAAPISDPPAGWQDLLEETMALADMVESLRSANAVLLQELDRLQDDLARARELGLPPATLAAPPLVPRGADWRVLE